MVCQRSLLLALGLASYQLVDIWKPRLLIEANQVGFDFTRVHQVNPGEKNAECVEKWLHARRLFGFEMPPLRGGESQIVMAMKSGDAAGRDPLQFQVLGRRLDDERRIKLLQC